MGSRWHGKPWQLVSPTAYPGDQRRSCNSSRPGCSSHTLPCSLHLLSPCLSPDSAWERAIQGENAISKDQPHQPQGSSFSFQSTDVGTWDIVQSCLPSMHEALSSVSSAKEKQTDVMVHSCNSSMGRKIRSSRSTRNGVIGL